MKTAISLPDDLFETVERLVRDSGRSRSELYSQALREYVARHSSDEVTAALNAVIAEAGETPEDNKLLSASARQVFEKTEW